MFLVLLFVPETAFILTSVHREIVNGTEYIDMEKVGHEVTQQEESVTEGTSAQYNLAESKHSYLKSLRFMTGRRYSDAPFRKILIQPAVVFFYPAVLWVFLIYGIRLTWIVVFGVVNTSIFTFPPYNFSVSEVELTSNSPFIMLLLGEVISGPQNDCMCLYLRKKNHGIYEPEIRLVLMFPVLLLGVAGFFGFGASIHSLPDSLDRTSTYFWSCKHGYSLRE